MNVIFEAAATQQNTGTLLFSSVVEFLGLGVCKIRPSANAAYQARPGPARLCRRVLRQAGRGPAGRPSAVVE